MKVMLDIDDTSVQFNRALIKFFNKRFNRNLKLHDVVNYDLSKVYQVTKKQIDSAMDDFYFSEDHLNIEIMPLADFSLYNLKKLDIIKEIILVTSRAERFRPQTRALLKKSFVSGILDEVELVMLGHYDSDPQTVAQAKCKSEICQYFGITTAFEDNAHHAEKIANRGLNVFMINQPWNINFQEQDFNNASQTGGQITRVTGWIDIHSHFRQKTPDRFM